MFEKDNLSGAPMRRGLAVTAVILGLAACNPTVEETQRGVGFQDYSLYQQQRAALARGPSVVPTEPRIAETAPTTGASTVTVAAAPRPGTPGQSVAADTMAALGVASAPAAPQAALPPVSEPLSALAPAPQEPVAAPAVAAPPATVNVGANIAAFALATTHPVGQQVYRRSGILSGVRFERACARFPSDGLAQEEFLRRGGPERDSLGLDPDGDGYACRWNPAPFRNIRN